MDLFTAFPVDHIINAVSSSSLFLSFIVTPLFLLFILKKTKPVFFKHPKLPPGPRPWPIIGNIHQVGERPHLTTANLAKIHGSLISLKLGSLPLIVASSPAAAAEILKTHDRLLSSRFIPSAFHFLYSPSSFLIWSDCTDDWKSLRTLCRTDLFSPKAIESQSSLREEKISQMLGSLGSKEGQVVAIGEVVFTTVFNMLSSLIFSKDFLDLNDEQGTAGMLKSTFFMVLESGIAPNIGDFYPKLFDRLDVQGLRKNVRKHTNELFKVWEDIIKGRRESKDLGSSDKHDFLDSMLANGFSNEQINVLSMELFTAGTDTTTSTVEWAMAELLKNKEVMSKVQEELKREINSGPIVESQLSKLIYLHACVKETLRLHPPVPFLLPHRALETCEVMNYTIPKNSQILVNIWAIGRDPTIWKHPLSFKPERFLDSSIDYKGQDFEFIPFGAGRRMCPGLLSGNKQVQFILASLIQRFDWLLPNNQDPLLLDMSDKFGVTLHKEQPLQLIFKMK